MQTRFEKLLKITTVVLNAEKIKLKRMLLEEEKIREGINLLDVKFLDRIKSLNEKGGVDLALFSGKDAEWEIWRQREKAILNIKRAALLAIQEEQIQQTQIAFGKNEAVRRLLDV